MTSLRNFKNKNERRRFIEKKQNIKLNNLNNALVDNEESIHIENIIGATSVPLGVAGPLVINGHTIHDKFYIPLATTEGALVGSVNRGCKAITFSGGTNTYSYKVGTTRGSVFYVSSLSENRKFCEWLNENEKRIASIAKSTGKYISYKKMMVKGLTQYIFVRFYFDTNDAMGMNMATIACQKIVQFIEKETGVKCLSVAGNFDIDKKPAWLNFINNRGHVAWAEIILKKKIIKEILKTDAQSIFDVWLGKCMLGSAMSGSLGFNAHFANIIAAFFAATGQDLAHVVEGSMGITTTKVLPNGDLYASVYLPAVMIATVGGGTGLLTQREARKIIKVNTSSEITEVLAGAVLAGEISLLASLAEGTLAKVHTKLGR